MQKLLPNGTKVWMPHGWIGIINGNNSEDTEEFENINYYCYPIKEYPDWDKGSPYLMLREQDLIVIKE